MKIVQAEYVLSAINSSQYPQSLQPEIALVGRSNVGKSSFINKFLNRKNLARTSSTPGKTQTINFYQINGAWFFVDLPGYGFAQVSKKMKSLWGQFIEEYLYTRQQLVGIIQVVDIRHTPTKDDILMQEWLVEQGLPYLVIATKADKLSRSKQLRQKEKIKNVLHLGEDFSLIIFSAVTGEGREEVATWLEQYAQPPTYNLELDSKL
ncbi:MAG TPA: YihA family ribosome biogenesis GTP-binding protein [Clostridia bacterium]|mgnify:CR=1 FL=1|jgi:GTP-binding protein|nr:ribosome biogenesis GTP-binding protein YihA/YsxC [Clostridia bacterium]HHY06346.1 YihA family ribosome biogenesis GTP-binding protein [Clostridia bacterium]